MKRKEYDHKYDNFSPISLSSSSSKTRRLDPDLLELTNYEDPRSCTVSDVAVEPLPEEGTEVGFEDFRCNDDKAIVLYNPTINNAPLYKSPSVSTDFSVVVNSDLIPGLKEMNSEMVRSLEQRHETTAVSDNRWAVVPWVQTAQAQAAAATVVAAPAGPAEAEEVEMADAEIGGETAAELSGGLQQWQQQQQLQHCMRPEFFFSSYTPVAW